MYIYDKQEFIALGHLLVQPWADIEQLVVSCDSPEAFQSVVSVHNGL